MPAEKLPHMNRCAPIPGDLMGLPDSMVDIDGFLPSWSPIESCLDSGIRPWEISVGVGGTLRLADRERPAELVVFMVSGFIFP